MLTFDIICLAKSIKHGGICIAGIKTDGSGWLRPVSNKKDGTLYAEHYTLSDGREPQIFDLIRIPCIQAKPKYHQPENWLIDSNKSWEMIGNPTLHQAAQLLKPEINKHSESAELLGNLDKKISYDDIKNSPVPSSLALIKPDKLQWEIKRNHKNEKKFRSRFILAENFYDLPITDPIWIDQLNYFEEGIYSCEEVIEELELPDFEPEQFRLTISLSEPFIPSEENRKFCYKLVATVINVADIKKRCGWS